MSKRKLLTASALLFFTLSTTTSCDGEQERKNRQSHARIQDIQDMQALLSRMIYFRDPQTNLCFMFTRFGKGFDAKITEVPCESVQKLLVNPEK